MLKTEHTDRECLGEVFRSRLGSGPVGGRGVSFAPLPGGCGMAVNRIRRLCAMEAKPERHAAVRTAGGAGCRKWVCGSVDQGCPGAGNLICPGSLPSAWVSGMPDAYWKWI